MDLDIPTTFFQTSLNRERMFKEAAGRIDSEL